jgi:hypothetical protein
MHYYTNLVSVGTTFGNIGENYRKINIYHDHRTIAKVTGNKRSFQE